VSEVPPANPTKAQIDWWACNSGLLRLLTEGTMEADGLDEIEALEQIYEKVRELQKDEPAIDVRGLIYDWAEVEFEDHERQEEQ